MIAWGGTYKNNSSLLQKIQIRILRIINKNKLVKVTISIKQQFPNEFLIYNNNNLKNIYISHKNTTRF